jgi:diacylglycerol kinase
MTSSFWQSTQHALHGIIYVYTHERSFRLQCFVAVCILLSAVLFGFEMWEYIVLVLVCASVLTLEVLNSALEVVLDILKPRLSAQVGVAKDIMAGAVMLASFCSVIIGGILFFPHVLEIL